VYNRIDWWRSVKRVLQESEASVSQTVLLGIVALRPKESDENSSSGNFFFLNERKETLHIKSPFGFTMSINTLKSCIKETHNFTKLFTSKRLWARLGGHDYNPSFSEGRDR
jgi:hypothetical protein